MTIKINKLEIENVKRVKAVQLEPSENGLTVVGGRNGQGKTSVLDSIAWALGGDRFKPSQADREGSVNAPYLKITMNNGLIVERKGKNSTLQVTDPNGEKAGQTLLNSFVEELAINLPKFMEATNKEKADTLLQIIGVGERLYELEKEEQEKYNYRRSIGQIADQKKKHAAELPSYDNVPDKLISTQDLINSQQEILARNGENQRKRQMAKQYKEQLERETYQVNQKKAEIERLKAELVQIEQQVTETLTNLETAQKTAEQLQDESTAEVEASLRNIDETNEKIRTNHNKDLAEQEAHDLRNQYEKLSGDIEDIRESKQELLKGADLPLPGLSVEDGELTYNGQKWDNMSGSEQLRVSTAIVRKLKPQCGFVLIDKLEQMDLQTLQEFGQWLEQEGLQAIAARVTGGEEATIIIEDGEVVGSNPVSPQTKTIDEGWKGGF